MKHETRSRRARRIMWKRAGIWVFIVLFLGSILGVVVITAIR